MRYALILALYLVVFRHDLLKADPKLLLLGAALFSVSLLVDQLADRGGLGLFEMDGVFHRAAEDGSKFVAIGAWAMFHFRAAWLVLERQAAGAAEPDGGRDGSSSRR